MYWQFGAKWAWRYVRHYWHTFRERMYINAASSGRATSMHRSERQTCSGIKRLRIYGLLHPCNCNATARVKYETSKSAYGKPCFEDDAYTGRTPLIRGNGGELAKAVTTALTSNASLIYTMLFFDECGIGYILYPNRSSVRGAHRSLKLASGCPRICPSRCRPSLRASPRDVF
eukprot:6178255-Pleurochrysis_carterae.AAC.1